MKSKWMRLLSLMLVAFMLLSVFCACAETPVDDGEEQPEDPGNTPGTTDPEDDPDKPIVYTADIPEGYHAGDITFTVYTFPEVSAER